MKVIAINGSPRKKNWNTVTMLENVLEGAKSAGADTELVHLYDMHFSGCISCFSCKKLSREKNGICAVQDELTPVLNKIRDDCDALVIGSPIYYGCETASMRAFLERLCFPCLKYDKERRSLFPRRIRTGLIYTMNVPEGFIEAMGYDKHFAITTRMLETYFGPCEKLMAADTMQYSDYDKYESEMFDKEAKIKRHEDVFPKECKQAYELGVRLVS